MLNKGKNRVHEKVKDMRQNYSKAVINETHSGCEKILYKHYDKLEPIWSVLQIPNLFHIVYEVMILKMAIIVKHFVTVVIIMMMRMVINTNETSDTANNVSQNKSDSIEDDNYENISPMKNCNKKRKSVVPQLIDNKCRHSQKYLSSAQLDKLLLDESKEDKVS